MSEKIEKLLSLLYKETFGTEGADRALYCLLKRYEENLPEPDKSGYFHKAFRQMDITESGFVDFAIWCLIKESKVFWKCFNIIVEM